MSDRPVTTYAGAHDRIVRIRGNARQFDCVDCGRCANEWSYNHRGIDECVDDIGRPYSLLVENYDPRCRPCHRELDKPAPKFCSHPGCGRRQVAKGECTRHYQLSRYVHRLPPLDNSDYVNPDATCKAGHPWTAENTGLRVQGGGKSRVCRACARVIRARYLERKSA